MKQRVNRFRIYRQTRDNPDDGWVLIWSFETEDAAQDMLNQLRAREPAWSYKLLDGGKEEVMELPTWRR